MAPRVIGYARVSTDDQDMALQRAALERYGVDGILEERGSGKSVRRKVLQGLVSHSRRGDVVVVWKLDRLGRTLTGVLEVVERMEKSGVKLVSLTENIDTTTAMGRAFMQMALVFAELERNMIAERTKAGIAALKAAGKRFGRKHMIIDNPKRMAVLRRLEREDRLRRPDGELRMAAGELRLLLNKADKAADPIQSDETIRRWKRGDRAKKLRPFHGLDEPPVDEPLEDE